jgi:hypothetical protein
MIGVIVLEMEAILRIWNIQTGHKVTEIFGAVLDDMFAWNNQSNQIAIISTTRA